MKKKGYVLIVLLFLSNICIGQIENDTVIYWSATRKLRWTDFKGIPPDSVNNIDNYTILYAAAATCASVSCIPKASLRYRIVVCFSKKESWTITNSDLTLVHEQLHFDISELFGRKIRKVFNDLNEQENAPIDKYGEAFSNFMNKRNEMNNLYDIETVHGILKNEQQKWNEKIHKELDELKEFEVEYSDY